MKRDLLQFAEFVAGKPLQPYQRMLLEALEGVERGDPIESFRPPPRAASIGIDLAKGDDRSVRAAVVCVEEQGCKTWMIVDDPHVPRTAIEPRECQSQYLGSLVKALRR